MPDSITLRTGFYFPKTIRFLGGACLFASMFLFFSKPWIALPLILLALIIFTTHYGFSLDPRQQCYHDYVWIGGMKRGERASYTQIVGLAIKQTHYRQTLHSFGSSMEARSTEYDGYLQFGDQEEIHLFSHKHKQQVIRKLQKLATPLQAPIVDYTEEVPKETPGKSSS